VKLVVRYDETRHRKRDRTIRKNFPQSSLLQRVTRQWPCCCVLVGLFLLSVAPARADADSVRVTSLKRRAFYPPYENLIRKHVPGTPLLGPGSVLDDTLLDRAHHPYRASYNLPDTRKILSDADRNCGAEKEQLIDGLIKIYPGKKGSSGVSAKFVNAIKDGLKVYPRSCIRLIALSGCEVHLSPIVTDSAPHLAGIHPAGYDEEDTWDNAGAVFTQGKWITIAEYRYWRDKLVPTYDYKGTAQHEAAHALDRFLGYPSRSIEFIEAYESDRKNMSSAMRVANHYFMQESERGPAEVFAETLASKYGDPDNKRWMHASRVFPHCFALVEQIFNPD
jgi:hypothetical protein